MTKILVLGAIFYVGICAFMFFRQEKLLFPAHLAPYTPFDAENTFKTADGTQLEAKVFDPKQEDAPLIVLFTGNAQNALLAGSVIWEGFEKNIRVATMNYRGYGNSEDSPNEQNMFADALEFTKAMKEKYQAKKVYLMGISLGTGVVSYLASQEEVDGLILMTPYDSITNVGAGQYPFLPVKYLMRNPFESFKHIQKVNAPVAIIRAENDELIKKERTDNLVKYIPNLAYDETEPHMSHTGILLPENRSLLVNQLKQAVTALNTPNSAQN